MVWSCHMVQEFLLYQILTGKVSFSDTLYLCSFRISDVGVALWLCWLRCGGASMGGHAWLVTSEDAKCERVRKSKIRARQTLENDESYNFCYSTFCVISTVRRTSAAQKSGSHSPTPPFTPVNQHAYRYAAATGQARPRNLTSFYRNSKSTPPQHLPFLMIAA